ncbi:hypothetical protein LPJ57_001299 [Coemansia sp. RSA 486]|nr:hypothetical protein LPJ57_001299 [Coemansia sp. RSA 486]
MTLLLVLKFRKNYSTLAVSLTNSSKFVKFAASHLYLDDSVVAIEKHFMLGDGVLLASFGNVLVDSIYCLTEYYDVTSAQLTSVRLAYHVFATAYLLVLYYKQRKASYELLPTTHVEVSA